MITEITGMYTAGLLPAAKGETPTFTGELELTFADGGLKTKIHFTYRGPYTPNDSKMVFLLGRQVIGEFDLTTTEPDLLTKAGGDLEKATFIAHMAQIANAAVGYAEVVMKSKIGLPTKTLDELHQFGSMISYGQSFSVSIDAEFVQRTIAYLTRCEAFSQ